MNKSTVRMTIALTLTGGVLGGAAQAKPDALYRSVSLNYVNLADDAEVTAQPVQTQPLSIKPTETTEPSIEIKMDQVIHSNLSGIGGAFNEQGGEAFMSLDAAQQKKLAAELFNAEKGIGFSQCRTAVGSSDFGLSAYSYSETPDDFKMKYFSVERDETTVIPFIKAAYAANPSLKIFTSPWSPPGWMKKSGKMDGGDKDVENNQLKADPEIFPAYALYFTKYVQEYAKRGVQIDRLIIQNEPDMNPKYPGCDMSPEQMAELAFDFIRPSFREAGLKTEIWAGSFRGKRRDANTFMTLDRAETIDGVGLQYCGAGAIKALHRNNPEMNFMHTEGKCWNAANSMEQARSRFGEVCMWLNGGCENYCYWNMVLNEESKSGWGWRQNSMIKIDRKAKTVTYNADYAPMALLSQFIRPGDQSLVTAAPDKVNALAVRNEKQVVVFLQNDAQAAATQNINLADQNYAVELPAQSLCAVVFAAGK